jgi:hypothetical protein
VNLKKGYLENWAIDALSEAVQTAYSNDDLKIEAIEAILALKRKV